MNTTRKFGPPRTVDEAGRCQWCKSHIAAGHKHTADCARPWEGCPTCDTFAMHSFEAWKIHHAIVARYEQKKILTETGTDNGKNPDDNTRTSPAKSDHDSN